MRGKFEDLTGMKFGCLTVIERVEDYVYSNGETRIQWRCKCDCGNDKKVIGKFLKNDTVKSCGCLKNNTKNLTGQRFGRLLVLNRNSENKKSWDCRCDCGNTCTVSTTSLHSGHTHSCGCLKKEITSKRLKRYNEYEVQEDYVIMYTQKGEIFFCRP